MPQVSMTVRMDSKLKASFDELCTQFGMSANTAMNIFANAVVRSRSIPFEITAPLKEDVADGFAAFKKMREMAQQGAFPEMTLEEINQEIAAARKNRKN